MSLMPSITSEVVSAKPGTVESLLRRLRPKLLNIWRITSDGPETTVIGRGAKKRDQKREPGQRLMSYANLKTTIRTTISGAYDWPWYFIQSRNSW